MRLPWWFSVKHESASGFLFGGFYLRWLCVISHDSFLFFFFMCVFFLTLFSLFFFSLIVFFFFYSTASKKKELAFFFCNNIMAAVQVCVCVSKPLFLLLFC